MQRLLLPAQIGFDAVRHLTWYLNHQVSGSAPRA
jgi:hypothetical protein